ncbi:MAG: hypothetical protein V7L29_00485 [Nostoc sp.]|uniref:hypothetical protein n=1 Tax=Nostoc sp. TaxID=1180 RepID=UPI002FF45B30
MQLSGCDVYDGLCLRPDSQSSNITPRSVRGIPETPLLLDVLPKPPDKNQLLPSSKLPNQPILQQNDLNARFRVDRIDVVGSTVFKAEQFAASLMNWAIDNLWYKNQTKS